MHILVVIWKIPLKEAYPVFLINAFYLIANLVGFEAKQFFLDILKLMY